MKTLFLGTNKQKIILKSFKIQKREFENYLAEIQIAINSKLNTLPI